MPFIEEARSKEHPGAPYANALVENGYVGISVEYRLFDAKKGITVFDSVKDGRAAIRYIRANAKSPGHVNNDIKLFDDAMRRTANFLANHLAE